MKQNSSVVFIHIPKTAGTSLHEMLKENLVGYSLCSARGIPQLDEISDEQIKKYDAFSGHFATGDIEARDIYNPKYITLLREPIDRIISLYNFWHNHKDIYHLLTSEEKKNIHPGCILAMKSTLEEFLETKNPKILFEINNSQSRYIAESYKEIINLKELKMAPTFNQVVEKLEKDFLWFGTVKQLAKGDLWSKILPFEYENLNLNVPHLNKSLWKEEVSEKALQKIIKLNEIDLQLYKYVTKSYVYKPIFKYLKIKPTVNSRELIYSNLLNPGYGV